MFGEGRRLGQMAKEFDHNVLIGFIHQPDTRAFDEKARSESH